MDEPPFKNDWDEDQRTVIQAEATSRLLIDAGPGTGKTAVACKRLARLIEEENLEPVNIWMICFTRAAVAEIRSRIHSYIGDSAFSIVISTIDAHAWAINSGHRPESKLFRDYDISVESALDLIKSDSNVEDEIVSIEHLIIDEAQDILGPRADLVDNLIKRLNNQCGITVFSDEAQAIFDFSRNENSSSKVKRAKRHTQLLDLLRDPNRHNFTFLALNTIHRTTSVGLKEIFSHVRSYLIDPNQEKHNMFERVKDGIMNSANRSDLRWGNLGLDLRTALKMRERKGSHLVLFRSRVEALLATHHANFHLSTRISHYPPRLPAWIALCFHDFVSPNLSEEEFHSLWDKRIIRISSQENDPERHWKNLMRTAGRQDGSVDMNLLTRRLGDRKPPLHLIQREYGLPGPIFGTIHASKGREADHVTLMMPGSLNGIDESRDIDEARVIFVGATRARKTLWVVKSTKSNSDRVKSGRAYRWDINRENVSVEVGREGDISFESLVGHSTFKSEDDAKKAQQHLAESAYASEQYELTLEGDSVSCYNIDVTERNICVGKLTSRLRADIKNLIRQEGYSYKPGFPRRFNKLYSRGCSTVVLASNVETSTIYEPWKQSRFALSPNICSFPSFPLN